MATTPRYTARGGREDGAVVLTFSLMLLFLLGFAAIAVDMGRLFIVRTELQTATDSCALAAAQELDGQSTAITRAISAGLTAGNLNRVNLQSADWDGQTKLVESNLTFFTKDNAITTDPTAARYVRCQHNQAGVKTFILPAMSAFNNSTQYSNTFAVAASALATRGHAQSTCPIPVALRARAGGTRANNYGFQVGEWITVKVSGKNKDDLPGAGAGEMGWYNLDGSNSASETVKEMSEKGPCGVKVGDKLGTPGSQANVAPVWNARFGIYKQESDGETPKDGPSITRPDLSGYSYSSRNWKNPPPQQNAFNGTPAAGSHPSAENFVTKRAKFASYDDAGSSIESGSTIVFGKANALNSFKKLATPGATGQHAQYGYNRRLVVVPVLSTSSAVIDFACMFMLAPLQGGPEELAQMEFRGNAGEADSPCTTSGMAGGSAGPLVPVLVR